MTTMYPPEIENSRMYSPLTGEAYGHEMHCGCIDCRFGPGGWAFDSDYAPGLQGLDQRVTRWLGRRLLACRVRQTWKSYTKLAGSG
ncbi:MAG: hypothetical protein ACYC5M_14725 [Anaerolineae bacterium]